MTCEFQLTATLEGVNKFLSGNIDGESDGSRKTLQSFKIAVSPTGEIVVFAKTTWLLICGSKWDSSVTDGARIKYSPSWHGHINCKPGEEITSIFCLPFFSQGQSSLGCADWTCIVLGLSSGFIRFYTDRMQELAYTILHEEKITDIKCFVSSSEQQAKHQKHENSDIYVLYKSVICIFNKFQLMQILHSKRNELAKGFSIKKNEMDGYLSIDFKKYSFVGQEEVTDACFLGQTLVSSFNTFDHLVTASVIGGFNSNYRASPPQTSLIITSGRRPFVGFHYTLEGANSPVLTDVALAVASKIKNSFTATLPDWFGFGSKKSTQSEKPKELSQEYAERLSCRFGLCDLWRQGQSVIVSPDGMLSAVADSLGRVILINNSSGIAHRLWKGFRDAQCGFLQVQEDVKKLRKGKDNMSKVQVRQGLFIVIYAPKKGLIEIFTTQHGRRVISFKVTKFGHLLYTPGAQIGRNISAGGFNLYQNQVLFVSEEGFYEISIPFHCALAEDSSKISRDLHVLKKMKILFKARNSNNSKLVEEIEKCARELKTDEVKLHAIESMITHKNITLEAFKSVLKVFLETFQDEGRVEPASKKIITFAKVSLDLVLLYEFLINLQDLSSNHSNIEESKVNIDSISEKLNLPQNELNIILKVIQQITEIQKSNQQTTKIAFVEKKSAKLVQYLTCFEFESFLNSLEKNEKEEENRESLNHNFILNLKLDGKENNLSYLGEVFFKGIFNSFSAFDQWKKSVGKCCLNPRCLALCLISYWCNKEMINDIFPEVLFFIEILKFICSLNDPNLTAVEYNIESPWWKELRNVIAGNPLTIRGIFAALCCRSVNIFIEQEREFSLMHNSKKNFELKAKGLSTNEIPILNNDWETISKDSCQWDILIVQLQDVALLNAVLNVTFQTENCITEIPFYFEQQCLTSIQAKGIGRISELVAKWLAQFGFKPTDLIDTNDLEFQEYAVGKEVEIGTQLIFAIDKTNEYKNCHKNLNTILEYLALLKSRFPYSLTSSSILSNMCWEYFAHWFKNVCDIHYLETAVQYLEVIPSHRIKYGISYLSWNTYLEQKFEILAKMINRIGKVPRDKLCVQEIGLRNDQVPVFLKLISDVLRIMFHTEIDDKPDFRNNKEAIWQTSSTLTTSSLVFIVLSQPVIDSDLILFQLQLSISLLMMSSLNVKHQRVFSSLFDSMERISLTQSGTQQLSSHYQNLKLKNSRTEFLKKCLSAAVQTIEIVEYIPPVSSDEFSEVVPSTRLKVEIYKRWLQLCFELAGMWAIPLEDLRKHQICELYSNEFDRLAEEIIPAVNDPTVLASQLLVLGGKRLKYLIQDSDNFSQKLTKLSANLSEWLDTLDLENFIYHGTIDDIEVLMRYSAKWLPEDHSDQKLALAIIESLSFLKLKSPEELSGNIS